MLSTRWTNPRDVDHYAHILLTAADIDPFAVCEIKYGPFRCTGDDTGTRRIWSFKYVYSMQRFAAAFPTILVNLVPSQRSHGNAGR